MENVDIAKLQELLKKIDVNELIEQLNLQDVIEPEIVEENEKKSPISSRNVIKLDNKLVEAKFDLKTPEEMKIFGIVVAQIDTEDQYFGSYEINVKELEKITGKKKNEKQLKDLANRMLKKTIFVEDPSGWIGYSLFSRIRYIRDEAKLEIKIDKDLKPFLLNLKQNFTKVNLLNYVNLDSSYAIRIYLFLKQYQKIGKRKFEIDKLREVLQTPKSYENFKNFRNKVLDIAKKEINTKTDLHVDYEITKKKGRKVVEIEFTIKEQKQVNTQKNITQAKQKKLNQTIKQIATKKQKELNTKLADISDFKLFRTKILNEYSDKLLLLNNAIYSIKTNYLCKNNEVLKKDDALDEWHNLFVNRSKIKIMDKSEYEAEQAKKQAELKQKIEAIKQKTYVRVDEKGEYLDEYRVVQVQDIDTKNNRLKILLQSKNMIDFSFTLMAGINEFYNYKSFKIDENNNFKWIS